MRGGRGRGQMGVGVDVDISINQEKHSFYSCILRLISIYSRFDEIIFKERNFISYFAKDFSTLTR